MKTKSNYRIVSIINNDIPMKVLGRIVKLPKYPEATFFIHKRNGLWRISEALSGSMVMEADYRGKRLISEAEKKFDSVIPERYATIKEMIDFHIKANNITPITDNIKILTKK